jgi:hypothetical protein
MPYRRTLLGLLGLIWVAFLLNVGKMHGQEFWVLCVILLLVTKAALELLGSRC